LRFRAEVSVQDKHVFVICKVILMKNYYVARFRDVLDLKYTFLKRAAAAATACSSGVGSPSRVYYISACNGLVRLSPNPVFFGSYDLDLA